MDLNARSLSDEDIQVAVKPGELYFEIRRIWEPEANLTSVSTGLELDRVISLAHSELPPRLIVSLMVPRFWSESLAKPTSFADLDKIKELFVPMDTNV